MHLTNAAGQLRTAGPCFDWSGVQYRPVPQSLPLNGQRLYVLSISCCVASNVSFTPSRGYQACACRPRARTPTRTRPLRCFWSLAHLKARKRFQKDDRGGLTLWIFSGGAQRPRRRCATAFAARPVATVASLALGDPLTGGRSVETRTGMCSIEMLSSACLCPSRPGSDAGVIGAVSHPRS